MASTKLGGFLMLVSIFLPVYLIYVRPCTYCIDEKNISWYLYWLFGVSIELAKDKIGVYFIINPFSIVFFGVLLISSIIAIKKDGLTQFVIGIFSLIVLISNFVYTFLFFPSLYWTPKYSIIVFPIMGFFLCIIGAIFEIIGGYRTNLPKM